MVCAFKIKSFLFASDNEKEAYIKGCKQLAKFMASPKYTNLFFKIERISSQKNTFKFTMYSEVDAKEEQKHYCKLCKEMHHSFFINENYNCSRCNLKAYLKRIEQRGSVQKGYYKKEIERRI